jgi:hypothetical protein
MSPTLWPSVWLDGKFSAPSSSSISMTVGSPAADVSGEDLSRWLVSSGLAMAFRRYSDHFAADEDAARAAGVGLWQTDFEPPWESRDKRWTTAAQEAPDGCPIKGNVNEDGERIYHTPWGSKSYTRTRVSTGQGECWFCSER